MPDQHTFSYPKARISVPSATPFYPFYVADGEETKVTFNQGYVFDFSQKAVNKVAVNGCSGLYAPESAAFFVHVITNPDYNAETGQLVLSAHIDETSSASSSDEYVLEHSTFAANGTLQTIALRENIHFYPNNGAGSEINHPWSVSLSGLSEGNAQWNVVGGTVYGASGSIVVPNSTVGGNAGVVALRIDRDVDSREPITAEIEFQETLPSNDYNSQYRALAQVDKEADQPVLQLQFEEIRIKELLIVENGEFKLAPFELSSRNSYELPS